MTTAQQPVPPGDRRTLRLASAIVLGTGILWGFYWLPVRQIEGMGLPGAWGTLMITAAAALALAPLAFARRTALRRADPLAVLSIALGGAAFALYSIGLVYGRVAIVILLYFLTPVWSTLIARYVLGWRSDLLRLLAIATGIAGLLVMLGAGGQVPIPRGLGEWLGLLAGFCWSVATTGIRMRAELAPQDAAFLFALGAAAVSLLLAPMLQPWPAGLSASEAVRLIGAALATGLLWWAVSIMALIWATARLEPARVGILLMTEVIVGSASAALFAGEALLPAEIAGGALVLCAAALEIWPSGGRRASRT